MTVALEVIPKTFVNETARFELRLASSGFSSKFDVIIRYRAGHAGHHVFAFLRNFTTKRAVVN